MSAQDRFGRQAEITGSIRRAVAVTPDDSNDLSEVSRAIWVGATGDLELVLVDGGGSSIVFSNVIQGIWHPFRASRVKAGSTTATGIRAGY
jgi:hypothetical protein